MRNPSDAQRAAARENGKKGGRPTSALAELKRKAREKATKLIAGEQEESVRFLIWIRDNPRCDIRERVRCAIELLNRGEIPAKAITAHGEVTADGDIGAPKLFVIGKFTSPEAPAVKIAEPPEAEAGNGLAH